MRVPSGVMNLPVLSILLLLLSVQQGASASLWPQPLHHAPGHRWLWFDANCLDITFKGGSKHIIRRGIDRFLEQLSAAPAVQMREAAKAALPSDEASSFEVSPCVAVNASTDAANRHHKHRIFSLDIRVRHRGSWPGPDVSEAYTLDVSAPSIRLKADTVFGALHGLETLSQLVRQGKKGRCLAGVLTSSTADDTWSSETLSRSKHRRCVLALQDTVIEDEPRFPHRGLLIDTARHFLSLDTIKTHLDAMAASKLNLLHWHIVDDQSFPYGSHAAPELPAKGAFTPDKIYSLADIEEVVQYARLRGIRVVAEFDTPGHTQSWGKGMPGLLTTCYDDKGQPVPGVKGPLNPTLPAAYGIMWELLHEASLVFPDPWLHLGGDEVDTTCWKSNPDIRKWMARHGMDSDADLLQRRWLLHMQGYARALGRVPVLWQEAFSGTGWALDPTAVVHVWKWWKDGGAVDVPGRFPGRKLLAPGSTRQSVLAAAKLGAGPGPVDPDAWQAELARVTAQGFKAVLSAPWYLNLGTYADEDWKAYYRADPRDFQSGNATQESLVLGGEACLWGEYVDDTDAIQRAWPAAAAVAERLWSPDDVTDVEAAAMRLQDHRCRLVARGIPASPLGPGECP